MIFGLMDEGEGGLRSKERKEGRKEKKVSSTTLGLNFLPRSAAFEKERTYEVGMVFWDGICV